MKYWLWDDVAPNLSSTGGPVDQSVSFQPDLGVPITRPRTTGTVETWSVPITFYSRAQFAEFEAWFRSDLQRGTLPFVWRHPATNAVCKVRIIPATYQSSYPGGDWVQVSLSMMILPGRLWFAPYVPDGSSRVPDFVADYSLGRYWIGQQEVSSVSLGSISGSYLIHSQVLTYTRRLNTGVYAGNVPQVAPANTDWIAGFQNAP